MEDRELICEIFKDNRKQKSIMWTAIIVLSCIVLMLVSILAVVVIHCQNTIKEVSLDCNNKIAEILADTDFYTEYELSTDNQSFNMGNFTVNK